MGEKRNRDLVNRIAADLTDRGRLIETGWLSLRAMAIPKNAPDVQINEMRMAFFAGAQHLYASMMGIMDPGREPTEQDMKRMQLIHEELDAFAKSLATRFPKP
jgi:hypothetical protein